MAEDSVKERQQDGSLLFVCDGKYKLTCVCVRDSLLSGFYAAAVMSKCIFFSFFNVFLYKLASLFFNVRVFRCEISWSCG